MKIRTQQAGWAAWVAAMQHQPFLSSLLRSPITTECCVRIKQCIIFPRTTLMLSSAWLYTYPLIINQPEPTDHRETAVGHVISFTAKLCAQHCTQWNVPHCTDHDRWLKLMHLKGAFGSSIDSALLTKGCVFCHTKFGFPVDHCWLQCNFGGTFPAVAPNSKTS